MPPICIIISFPSFLSFFLSLPLFSFPSFFPFFILLPFSILLSSSESIRVSYHGRISQISTEWKKQAVGQTSVSCGTCREQGITLEMDVGSLLASNSCVGRLYFGTSPTFAREISLNGQTNMTRIVLIIPILARSHH